MNPKPYLQFTSKSGCRVVFATIEPTLQPTDGKPVTVFMEYGANGRSLSHVWQRAASDHVDALRNAGWIEVTL